MISEKENFANITGSKGQKGNERLLSKIVDILVDKWNINSFMIQIVIAGSTITNIKVIGNLDNSHIAAEYAII